MSGYLEEYFPLVVFFALSLALVSIDGNTLLAAVSNPDPEKNSAYECNFEPFGSELKFDVRFYLVAILFVIFDLEVAFLFLGSWISVYWNLGILVNDTLLLILTIGFLYEWKKGALEWE